MSTYLRAGAAAPDADPAEVAPSLVPTDVALASP